MRRKRTSVSPFEWTRSIPLIPRMGVVSSNNGFYSSTIGLKYPALVFRPRDHLAKWFQVVPSTSSFCICLIGAKSSALVCTWMPGSSIGSFRSLMLAACFIISANVGNRPYASRAQCARLLYVAIRPIAFGGVMVAPVEERAEGFENERFVLFRGGLGHRTALDRRHPVPAARGAIAQAPPQATSTESPEERGLAICLNCQPT
jgi:hypothetical protein